MNIQRDTEYRFGELVLSPEYSNELGVVVTIKSLATGLTMKVYLDEPTKEVIDGINITTYEGHYYEEEFMFTPSEGFETTGFPLMYPYDSLGLIEEGMTIVIDTQNHSIIISDNTGSDPVDMASLTIRFGMQDFPLNVEIQPTSGNQVFYNFTRFFDTSEEPVPFNPGSGVGPISDFDPITT